VFVGLAFAMAWSSMASPALFAVIADSLPRDQRTMGFTVQSIMRRLPIAVAPTLGGIIITALGVRAGIRLNLLVTLVLAAVTLGVVARVRIAIPVEHKLVSIRGVWGSFPMALRRLLISDIFIRTCEGMVDVFLVLYAINIVGISAAQFGVLIAVEMTTAMFSYAPGAHLADRSGRKPFVIATFLAFSLFPIAVVLARSWAALLGAYVVGGLREVGEPARKALILNLAQPELRARSVGLYYLTRSLAIAPAAFVGGLLWKIRPAVPFMAAGAIGIVGTMSFAFTVEERYAA
jgi:MFS family permease